MNVFTFLLLAGTCLTSAAEKRIVGGEITTIQEYPAIVAIESLSWVSEFWAQSCGGNILTTRWILSAAHCFDGILYEPARRRVRAGSSFRNTGGQVVRIVTDHKHPSYGQLGMDGDITLILLWNALEFNPVVASVNIITQGFELPNGSPVVHAGWGTTAQGGLLSEQLRHATIHIIDRELCRQRYSDLPSEGGRPVTANMICAGLLEEGGRDACQGDYGGPLYYTDATDRRILVGIASWGEGCANDTYYGLSTKVASYSDWIVATAI